MSDQRPCFYASTITRRIWQSENWGRKHMQKRPHNTGRATQSNQTGESNGTMTERVNVPASGKAVHCKPRKENLNRAHGEGGTMPHPVESSKADMDVQKHVEGTHV